MIALSRRERRRYYRDEDVRYFSINSSLVEAFLKEAHRAPKDDEISRFLWYRHNEMLSRDEMLGWNQCEIFPDRIILLYREHERTGCRDGDSLLFIGETAVEFLRFIREEYSKETVKNKKMLEEACSVLEKVEKKAEEER